MKIIGANELTWAAEAHMERMQLYGPDPISRIIESVGVDSEEFQACIQVLRDARLADGMEPGDSEGWAAGVIDGFVLGVRAARRAEANG